MKLSNGVKGSLAELSLWPVQSGVRKHDSPRLPYSKERLRQKMPEVGDLRNVVENVISSYEAKIQSMSSLFDTTSFLLSDVQESIFDYKGEREKINSQLRETLAKNESLRKKDFDNFMRGVLSNQEQEEQEAKDLLRKYLIEQKNQAQVLKQNLMRFKDAIGRGDVKKIKEIELSIKEALAKQGKEKDEIVSKLRNYQRDQNDLTVGIKQLLAKGDDLRIKDFKTTLNEFKAQRDERIALKNKRKEDVAKMLDKFKKERQRFASSGKAVDIDDRQ